MGKARRGGKRGSWGGRRLQRGEGATFEELKELQAVLVGKH